MFISMFADTVQLIFTLMLLPPCRLPEPGTRQNAPQHLKNNVNLLPQFRLQFLFYHPRCFLLSLLHIFVCRMCGCDRGCWGCSAEHKNKRKREKKNINSRGKRTWRKAYQTSTCAKAPVDTFVKREAVKERAPQKGRRKCCVNKKCNIVNTYSVSSLLLCRWFMPSLIKALLDFLFCLSRVSFMSPQLIHET